MGKPINFQDAAKRKDRKRLKQLMDDLLECIYHIVELDPWELLDAGDPVAYIPKSEDQMIFFSCVQEAQNSLGIMVFPSPEDYARLVPDEGSTYRQELRNYVELSSITVYLTEKEEVPPEIQQLYQQLSMKFGPELWPWVSCKMWGHPPDSATPEELEFLLDCLKNFYMQLRALDENRLAPDFAQGDMLLRFYSPPDQLWMNVITPLQLPPRQPAPVEFREDSEKLKKLREQPASSTVQKVEFDFGWRDEPTQDSEDDQPYFPLQVVFTDRESGELLSSYMCRPEQLLDCAFTAWSEVIYHHGIPKMLYVCRDQAHDLFEDFTRKLGVKLKRVKHLPATQRVLRSIDAV